MKRIVPLILLLAAALILSLGLFAQRREPASYDDAVMVFINK